MKKTAVSAVILSLVISSLSPMTFAEDLAGLSELDFPEEEGINIVDDETGFIEMPDYAILSDESRSETIYISTVEDLQELHKNMITSSGYSINKRFVLSNNLDLGGMEWTPIGYNSSFANGTTNALLTYAFNGIFDGNGNTISNFKMTDAQNKYLGFFGSVAGGTIKDLNLENVTIDHRYSVSDGSYGAEHYSEYNSLLVGFSNYATISGCNVSGSISLSNDTSYGERRYMSAGMITGAGIAKIDNCRANGSITTDALINTYVGGIFGNAGTSNTYFKGSVKNCTSSVIISSNNASPLHVGGIIGRSSSSIDDVTDCSFTGSVSAVNRRRTGGSTSDISAYAGGIAGYSNSPIINCSAGTGAITAFSDSSPNAGGIAGRTSHRIEGCTVNNSITSSLSGASSSGTASIGGIAGICGSSYSSLAPLSLAPANDDDIAAISNCTVSASASLKGESGSTNFMVAGGIAGTLYAPSSITNCVCASPHISLSSSVSGIYFGGIAGYLNGGSIEYCTASGTIGDNVSSASTLYAGGIAGIARIKRFLTYDMSYGVQSSDFIETKVYGSYINGCAADMSISPQSRSAQYLGGIVGYVSGIYSNEHMHISMDRELVIENSRYIGDITVNENALTVHAGGISGQVLDGTLRNLYAAGNIESIPDDSIERYIGGAVGTLKQANHNEEVSTSSIKNCYAFPYIIVPDGNTSTISDCFIAELAPSSVSGIEPTSEGCFFYSDDENAVSNTALRLSSEAFSEKASFPDWDFDRIWRMNGTRPILRFEETGLYMPLASTSDPLHIGSLMVSRPKAGTRIIAAAKDSAGRIVDTRVFTLDPSNIETSAFTTLGIDMDIAENAEKTELYIWDNKNMPLSDMQDAAEYIRKY